MTPMLLPSLSSDSVEAVAVPSVSRPTIPRESRQHYPALDGMRGVAILGVLLFHAFLGLKWDVPFNISLTRWPMMGWGGVDIFFVLSGFLITGILLDTRASPAHFRNFYSRRFLRIIPIYYLVLTVIFLVLPWFVAFDTDGLKTIQHRQGWLWTHLTNLSFVYYQKVWCKAGWLDLSHLWSLAVEEQFYLVWPIVVYFLSRRSLKLTCLACVLASLTLRIVLWQTGQRNGAMYFPTPCRLDGLAMGAFVAVLVRENRGVAAIIGSARVVGWTALAMLVGLIILRGGFVFTDKPAVVFGITMVNLISASVIVLIAEPRRGSPLSAVLNSSFLRTIGKYSYGMYLFHCLLQPPLEILISPSNIISAVGSELLGNLIFVAIFCLVTYAVAFLSWHAYEKHWLKLKKRFE